MYVEASEHCNMLSFTMGATGVGANIATRAWSIKVQIIQTIFFLKKRKTHNTSFSQVSQYSCNYPNLAPQGCTQYFFGETTSQVRSYNWNGGSGIHLASQDQTICIR